MALIEALTLSLGPSIGKAVLKRWVGKSGIGEDVGSALIDVIKSKTTDVLAQQRARRQFEAIGERVAEGLAAVFEAEGVHVSESSRIAVAYAVAETLDTTVVNPSVLAEHNLEPATLADHFLAASSTAALSFSADETALYRRIISESTQYIVDIASQLPSFTERTFAEVLKREGELLSITEAILAQVRLIRKEAERQDIGAARFETEYRRAVIRQLDELQLFGVDVSTASRRHRLSVAYVTLSVGRKATDVSCAAKDPELGSGIIEDESVPDDDEEETKTTSPADAALAAGSRWLVVGEAGSGKTTLLQWIAVRSAQADFEGPLRRWNGTVPFFIRLRQFTRSPLPSPEQFPRLLSSATADTMPAGWVSEQLRLGRGIILVDGLDEVREQKREEVRKWLQDLVGAFPACRFVASSRPHALEADWMAREEFAEAELLPMDLPDIWAFVNHWHDAVREQLRDGQEKDELSVLSNGLQRIIRTRPQVRNLATNPLLCAMLCALHRERNREIPSDRIELYEACLRMLIDRRDRERHVDLGDYPRLTYRQKVDILQDLAYWFLKNGYSTSSTDGVDDRLSLRIKSIVGQSWAVTGKSVRRLFVERSGILREPVKAQIDFTHRTFQDFLAARAVLEEGDIGLLVTHSVDELWRDVVALASGLARPKERGDLIMRLIERGDNEWENRHQLHLLAVACLETSVGLEEHIRANVERRLSRLVPPRNLTEAKALASAGELAVPHLSREGYLHGNLAAASIRTLSLIGSEGALDAIGSYKGDNRRAVRAEITRAWEYFNREEYAQRVLLHDHIVDLSRPTSLEGIQYLSTCKSLRIRGATGLGDISPIGELKLLERLMIFDCTVLSDLTPISGLGQLKDLWLTGCESLEDLRPLATLPSLKLLGLIEAIGISDLGILANLPSLKTLYLTGCLQMADLTSIGGLLRLEKVVIWSLLSLTDIGALSGLSSLTTVEIKHCPRLRDLSPLVNLPQLESLTAESLHPSVRLPDCLRSIRRH